MLALLSQPARAADPRFFELCKETEFRIVDDKRFEDGHVFSVRRLGEGQSVLDCLEICKMDEDCWSFNYSKTRKSCFLMSTGEDEASTKSIGSFAMGYRTCVEEDFEWLNEPIDFGKVPGTLGRKAKKHGRKL